MGNKAKNSGKKKSKIFAPKLASSYEETIQVSNKRIKKITRMTSAELSMTCDLLSQSIENMDNREIHTTLKNSFGIAGNAKCFRHSDTVGQFK